MALNPAKVVAVSQLGGQATKTPRKKEVHRIAQVPCSDHAIRAVLRKDMTIHHKGAENAEGN